MSLHLPSYTNTVTLTLTDYESRNYLCSVHFWHMTVICWPVPCVMCGRISFFQQVVKFTVRFTQISEKLFA